MYRIKSLPLTNLFNLPFKTNFIDCGTFNHTLPVAREAPISVEPTPVENAPSAP